MGTLYVVATPIGNLEDISLRAIRLLLTVSVIACEDTRHTGNLIKLLTDRYAGILNLKFEISNSRKFISVRDWNEAQVVDQVLLELQTNDVALVSDSGTPLISDPGFKVVRAARKAGFLVSPIPGPSAAIAALSIAGLPTDKFVFLGFLGKKWDLYPGITNIIYESPQRLKKTVDEIYHRYPLAQVVLAKELTKLHEEVLDPKLKIENWDLKIGEAVILVNFSPSSPTPAGSP